MTDWSHIGTTLRQSRESRGLTVHDVAHSTRIPVKALHELEEGDFSGFASPAYAKSFLGQYCHYLQLDCDDWLDDFQLPDSRLNLDPLALLDYDEPEDEEESLPATRHHHAPAAKAEPRRHLGSSGVLQPAAVFLATAMLIAAGIYGFVKLNDRLGQIGIVDEPAPVVTIPVDRPAVQPPAPAAPSPPLAANSSPQGSRSAAPVLSEDRAEPLAIESQPPRAVIVEE